MYTGDGNRASARNRFRGSGIDCIDSVDLDLQIPEGWRRQDFRDCVRRAGSEISAKSLEAQKRSLLALSKLIAPLARRISSFPRGEVSCKVMWLGKSDLMSKNTYQY